LLGLVVVWSLPWFWLSFTIVLLLYLSPTLLYVHVRNQHVKEPRRLLTVNYFRRRFGLEPLPEPEAEEPSLPVRLPDPRGREGAPTAGPWGPPPQEARTRRAMQVLLLEAVNKRASEIVLAPGRRQFEVRMRVDGTLQPPRPFTRRLGEGVLRRFKELAHLNA